MEASGDGDQSRLSNDFDTKALENFHAMAMSIDPKFVDAHIRLVFSSAYKVSEETRILYALIAALHERLLRFESISNSADVDPLAHYENRVSPILNYITRPLKEKDRDEAIDIDLNSSFIGYNWSDIQKSHGYPGVRWLEVGQKAGILVPYYEKSCFIAASFITFRKGNIPDLEYFLNGAECENCVVSLIDDAFNVVLKFSSGTQTQSIKGYPFAFLEINSSEGSNNGKTPTNIQPNKLGLTMMKVKVF